VTRSSREDSHMSENNYQTALLLADLSLVVNDRLAEALMTV